MGAAVPCSTSGLVWGAFLDLEDDFLDDFLDMLMFFLFVTLCCLFGLCLRLLVLCEPLLVSFGRRGEFVTNLLAVLRCDD